MRTGEKQRVKRRAQHAEKVALRLTVYIPCQVCGTEIVRKTVRTKWCSESCRTKARHAADPDLARRKMARWRSVHPDQAREALERWRDQNRERVRAHSRRASRNRSAWKASTGNGISLAAWVRLINRFGNRCAYCDERPAEGYLEPDHVVPLSRGGAHTEGNILPACPPCNRRKCDRLLIEVRTGRRVQRRRRPIS